MPYPLKPLEITFKFRKYGSRQKTLDSILGKSINQSMKEAKNKPVLTILWGDDGKGNGLWYENELAVRKDEYRKKYICDSDSGTHNQKS